MAEIKLNDIVISKKMHPCKNNEWQVIRLGSDVKLKCMKCERVVMMTRSKLSKFLK